RRSSDLYFRSKLPGQVYADGLLWAWAYVLAKVVQSDSTVRRLPAFWAFASPPLVFYCIFLYLSGFVRCSKSRGGDAKKIEQKGARSGMQVAKMQHLSEPCLLSF